MDKLRSNQKVFYSRAMKNDIQQKLECIGNIKPNRASFILKELLGDCSAVDKDQIDIIRETLLNHIFRWYYYWSQGKWWTKASVWWVLGRECGLIILFLLSFTLVLRSLYTTVEVLFKFSFSKLLQIYISPSFLLVQKYFFSFEIYLIFFLFWGLIRFMSFIILFFLIKWGTHLYVSLFLPVRLWCTIFQEPCII